MMKSQLIVQVKKAVCKRMNLKKRTKQRLTMKKSHMRVLSRSIFKVKGASKEEQRLLAMIASMCFCIKGFSDVIEWKWEVFQKRSKTDQKAEG